MLIQKPFIVFVYCVLYETLFTDIEFIGTQCIADFYDSENQIPIDGFLPFDNLTVPIELNV